MPIEPNLPYRACLYRMDGRGLFNTGTVIARRDDGAQLFRYDDGTSGDHGFRWVDTADGVRLGRCKTLDPVTLQGEASSVHTLMLPTMAREEP